MPDKLGWDIPFGNKPSPTRHAVSIMKQRVMDDIVREVAELPDRTSPEDRPDMMLVTADELRAILATRI